MRVAIVGCGPAGLIAAHAAHQMGAKVSIFSKKEKSVMPGAQYLHERIPDITPYEPAGYLCMRKEGTREGYAKKVYGDPAAPVSWDSHEEGYVPAWSLLDTYNELWRRWGEHIVDTGPLGGVTIRENMAPAYDVVLSSIPAPAICRGGCRFDGVHVWFTDRAWSGLGENEILYSGEPEIPWYRTSNIFGHSSTEWSYRPNGEAVSGFKPTENNCRCAPDNLVPIGRFGKWDKRVLVHQTYSETKEILSRVA